MQFMRKAMAARAAAARTAADQPMRDPNDPTPMDTSTTAPTGNPQDNTSLPSSGTAPEASSSHPRQAWEHVDEVLQTLKTTFPLLILSLETMVDQIQHKFKPAPEEDVYRNICMLLSDAVQVRFFHLLFRQEVPNLLELCCPNQLT